MTPELAEARAARHLGDYQRAAGPAKLATKPAKFGVTLRLGKATVLKTYLCACGETYRSKLPKETAPRECHVCRKVK